MNWLKRTWHWLLRIFRRPPRPYTTIEATDLPNAIKAREVYLIGENGYLWYVAMLCPCGCGATVQLSCLPDARPCWGVSRHADQTISLHPSVARLKGCKSHYFLKRGQIIWCASSDRENR